MLASSALPSTVCTVHMKILTWVRALCSPHHGVRLQGAAARPDHSILVSRGNDCVIAGKG